MFNPVARALLVGTFTLGATGCATAQPDTPLDSASVDLQSVDPTNAQEMVDAAKVVVGRPYSWGGGNSYGAGPGGIAPDGHDYTHVAGFDSAGLLDFLTYQPDGGGLAERRSTAKQYAHPTFENETALGPAGTEAQRIPVADAQPGDFLFWSTDPARTSADAKAAIVVDDSTMIEVTEASQVVQQTERRGDRDGLYLMPFAIRFYP